MFFIHCLNYWVQYIEFIIVNRYPPVSLLSKDHDLEFTTRAKKVIESSIAGARALADRPLRPEHFLVGLVSVGGLITAELLRSLGLNIEDARRGIMKSVSTRYPTYF